MLPITVTLILLCCLATSHGDVYQNQYDGLLDFKCPSTHQFLSYIWSHHDNHHEDRIFKLQCQPVVGVEYIDQSEVCFWSPYVNNYDAPFAYNCPTNHYIAGMHSEHNNHYEDRKFKFWCCSIPTHHESDCEFSGFINHYDQEFSYTVPLGSVMKGMVSIHDSHSEDRIFDFEVCTMEAYPETAVG